jgi:nitrate reductase NapE component
MRKNCSTKITNRKNKMDSTTTGTVSQERYNTFAILGLISSFMLWPLGFVFSTIARRQLKADPSQKGAGMAKAGLIISWVIAGFIILFVLLYMILGVALVAGMSAV